MIGATHTVWVEYISRQTGYTSMQQHPGSNNNKSCFVMFCFCFTHNFLFIFFKCPMRFSSFIIFFHNFLPALRSLQTQLDMYLIYIPNLAILSLSEIDAKAIASSGAKVDIANAPATNVDIPEAPVTDSANVTANVIAAV